MGRRCADELAAAPAVPPMVLLVVVLDAGAVVCARGPQAAKVEHRPLRRPPADADVAPVQRRPVGAARAHPVRAELAMDAAVDVLPAPLSQPVRPPVTVDDDGLHDLGYRGSVAELIVERARTALSWGCDGIIAAPRDGPNQIRRAAKAEGLLVVTPGIRPPGAPIDDPKRAGTPAEASAAGADYLVVGRPIIRSDDPARAAAAIIENMRSALEPSIPVSAGI